MDLLQRTIYRLEEGGGIRYMRVALVILGTLLIATSYNWRLWQNFGTQEAMDSAQLARNIATGQGYTTQFIRPLSMYLVQKSQGGVVPIQTDGKADPLRIRGAHPDLANPPVYPVVLAGLMKVLPFRYAVPEQPQPFWSVQGQFARYQPDFLITVFNQLLFFGLVFCVYRLAGRLFNPTLAVASAVLLLGTELLWRFSTSGLSTMLLLLLFTSLSWTLVRFSQETAAPEQHKYRLIWLAAIAGLWVGIGALTRYSFGWLIIPVAVFLGLVANRQRVAVVAAAILVFAALLTPWVIRNVSVGSLPFGIATYAVFENSGDQYGLQRSLEPQVPSRVTTVFRVKLAAVAREILQNDLPALGGTWLTAFFLAGLLVPISNVPARHLRNFLAGCLPLLIIVQALGRTQLSTDSPVVNSENQLILLLPLVIVFGTSLFLLLLDQVEGVVAEFKTPAIAAFVVVVSLPLLLSLTGQRRPPLSYPPYYPPFIQTFSGWLQPTQLTMSDIPWAVAWYGQRQSVWLTPNTGKDFEAINSYQKPVTLVHLSSRTLDQGLLSQLTRGTDNWIKLAMTAFSSKDRLVPFGLPFAYFNYQQMIFCDSQRWLLPTRGSASEQHGSGRPGPAPPADR